MAEKKNQVDATSAAYDLMAPRWDLIDTILEGTEAMRAAGNKYMPQHPEETTKNYNVRLERATLVNQTEQTLDELVGKAFDKPPVLSEKAPEPIVEFSDDVDTLGTGLASFCQNWFRSGTAKAFCHVLVDFTKARPATPDKPRTLDDDRKENLRPYWVLVQPEDLIFAASKIENGREVLTQVRIKECVVEQDGFLEKVVERIRVLYPDHYELWEFRKQRGKKTQWVVIETGPMALGYIPLVTFYTDREGLMIGKPPLQDLAFLNVAHWQSSSDQRNVLTVARFPMLAASGAMDAEDADSPMTVGPNKWLFMPDPQGKFYYVEHSGAAIEAGRNDLKDLEDQMANYGAAFLKKRPGDLTATERSLDSAEGASLLQTFAVSFVHAVNQALEITCDWLKVTETDEAVVAMDIKALATGDDSPIEVETLREMRKNKDISRVAFLTEMIRRRVLPAEFDIEEDADLLEEEAPDPALTGMLDPNGEPIVDPATGLPKPPKAPTAVPPKKGPKVPPAKK
jgi:hypothetical protein